MGRELKRLNTNMPVELVERIDEYAERMCINRSSAINVLCSMALDSQKAMNDIGKLIKMAEVNQPLNNQNIQQLEGQISIEDLIQLERAKAKVE